MSFESYMDGRISNTEIVLINTLERVGQLAVNEARDNGTYLDDTANLRSSVGYVIAKDGVVVRRGAFEAIKDGQEGASGGQAFAEKIATQTSGLTLIVVAGMHYAIYVETHRNVLASSQILAEREVPRLLKAIGLIK